MNFLDDRLPSRFWDKVIPEPNSGCWLWTANTVGIGYGRIWYRGKDRMAHRVAFEAVAEIDKPQLDHRCKNPGCVNPAHLEPVTASENIKRSRCPAQLSARMRAKSLVDSCPKGHKYRPVDAHGKRYCAECKIQRKRDRRGAR